MLPASEAGSSIVERKMNSNVKAAMLFLICSLMVSSLFYQILRGGNFSGQFSSSLGITLFIALAVIPYVAALYLFRKFISPVTKSLAKSSTTPSYFRLAYNLLRIALISSAGIVAVIIFQVVTTSEFNLALTILSLQPNAILVTILMIYLGYKFLSWFRASRNLATFFLGLTFVSIAVGTAVSDVVNTGLFLLDDPARKESSNPPSSSSSGNEIEDISANLKSDPRLHDLFLIIQLPSRLAFVFYWVATASLLRNYSKSIGKTKFWILVGLPLAMFVIASVFIYGGFGSLLFRGIISSAYGLIAGILFGIIFLTIARRLGKNSNDLLDNKKSQISNYLTMSVFGTVLFLITSIPPNHIIDWVHVPYPPFADVVWSFIGFAAYLYSFGVFFSTVAVSKDSRLRKSLHNLAIKEADMLHSLGSTQMEEELQKRVTKISREQGALLKEQTGIEQEVTPEEMKQYVEEVMEHIQKISGRK
jgi:hypothetical protein